jgi:hypothetical protein
MGLLDSTGHPAQRAGTPVKITQAIQYRPVYAVFGIRLEVNMARGVKPLNGLDQSKNARMDQIFKQNMRWKPIMNSLCDVFDLRKLIN